MKRLAFAAFLLASLAAGRDAAGAATAEPALVREGQTATLGYTGDFDHLAIDLKGNRLLLAAEDHGSIEVFDLKDGRHLRTVGGFQTPHSIFAIPSTHRWLVTDGSESIKLLDDGTLAVVGTIKLHPGADSIGFDAANGHLYVVTGGKDVKLTESWLEEIDPVSTKKLGEIHIDAAHVEAMAVEQKGPRVYVNVADKNFVAVIDKASRAIVARWPMRDAKQNALAELDEAHHRLFVVARDPGRFIAIDTLTGTPVASLAAPKHVDAELFDAASGRIYVTGGEGFINVYSADDPNHVVELARIASAEGAKTAVLAPELNRLYVAVSPGEGRTGGEVLWFRITPRAH